MRGEDYTCARFPHPLLATKRVGEAAKRVWVYVFSWRKMGRPRYQLTEARLSRDLAMQRRHVAREVKALLEVGLLKREVVIERSGSTQVEFTDLWPEWLSEEGLRFLEVNADGDGGSR